MAYKYEIVSVQPFGTDFDETPPDAEFKTAGTRLSRVTVQADLRRID